MYNTRTTLSSVTLFPSQSPLQTAVPHDMSFIACQTGHRAVSWDKRKLMDLEGDLYPY